MTPQDALTQIIRPTLQAIGMGLWTPAAEELLLGTAIKESALVYTRQIGGGPGRGYWQMEPATHDDIWKNYLAYRPKLANAVSQFLEEPVTRASDQLETNANYACAMARIKYLRVPDALPNVGDLAAQAAYWKQWYNTPAGAGTADEYVDAWHQAFGEEFASLPSATSAPSTG